MGEANPSIKPHAVLVPHPAQGHVFPMLKIAKLLYARGFHITFVNTEYNQRWLLRSHGPSVLEGLPSFRFESITDGLPLVEGDIPQDALQLCESIPKNCIEPFKGLLKQLNSTPDVPPVTCVISDGVMSFTLPGAEELGIPNVLFWTTSACGFLGYAYYHQLVQKGFTPFKDFSHFTNGYLDTSIDWIPGMEGISLKYLPSFIRTTNPKDIMLNFAINEAANSKRASGIILNTFDVLEREVLDALSSIFPPVHAIGPLHLLEKQIPETVSEELKAIELSMRKAESGCLEWLDEKEPNSVIYVSFGSVAQVPAQVLTEFAWGLANSKQNFLWALRRELLIGETAILPPEFEAEIKGRGFISNWCPQEKVLKHPSIGGFLTHCGWNSTLEGIVEGVPMICWPAVAEQTTNCWFLCEKWGIGMEIKDINRDEIEELVRTLLTEEKGKDMKRRALEWKKLAEKATSPNGSSYENFYGKVVDEILLSKYQ